MKRAVRIGVLASVLLTLSQGGAEAQVQAAQELEGLFSGLAPSTPRIPPPAVGRIEMPVHSAGQEADEDAEEAPALPGMALGASLGSLAGTATGVLTVVAFCQDDCDYSVGWFSLLAAGWVGGTTGSAIGVWTAGNEDGVTGGDAVLASLVGGAVGLAAGIGWGFPVVQGLTTAGMAELLRQ